MVLLVFGCALVLRWVGERVGGTRAINRIALARGLEPLKCYLYLPMEPDLHKKEDGRNYPFPTRLATG